MLVYLVKLTQVRALIFNNTITVVPVENSHYSDVFSTKIAVEILKYSKINNHAIKLNENKHLFFKTIYSRKPIQLCNVIAS